MAPWESTRSIPTNNRTVDTTTTTIIMATAEVGVTAITTNIAIVTIAIGDVVSLPKELGSGAGTHESHGQGPSPRLDAVFVVCVFFVIFGVIVIVVVVVVDVIVIVFGVIVVAIITMAVVGRSRSHLSRRSRRRCPTMKLRSVTTSGHARRRRRGTTISDSSPFSSPPS